MKRILLSIGVVMTSMVATSQVMDTLTEFFTGTPTLYSAQGGGVASGNNAYGDLAKMQLFDGTYGVAGGGAITNLLLWAPIKVGTTGTFRAVIWANNAGVPGAELGSATISLSAVDTAMSAMMFAENSVVYNVNATFASPIAVPANLSFWAGIELPTATGSGIALMTNTDGDFPAGLTHTGEFWEDNTFHTFGDPQNWNLKVALAIFPVINFVAGVNANEVNASVFPNPAVDVLNINLSENATSVAVLGMDGKVISKEVVSSNAIAVNVADLVSGVYFYEVTTENGSIVRNTFMKK